MNKFTVITSFNAAGYESYGKKFLETFKKNWPKDVKLRAYFHDMASPTDAPKSPNIKYVDLLEVAPFIKDFRRHFPTATGQQPQGYNYRMDAQKFIHKMFALFDGATKVKSGKLIWLDGDTFTKEKITKKFLVDLCGSEDIVHLGRTAINYSETSFLSFDMKSTRSLEFLADFRQLYTSGEIFGFSEWHDGFVFERLLNIHKPHGLTAKNLTPTCKDLNAFGVSPLAKYMEHLKGALKNEVPQGGSTSKGIKIIPKNAVADEVILRNVDDNRKIINRWVKRCMPHGRKAVIISGGPSAKEHLDKIRELQEEEAAVLFCVKHSHNMLIENGVIPKFCVLLDPRPYDGLSTHNMKRSELIAKPDSRIQYLTASMVDPFVTKHLLSNDVKPLGWHAWTNTVAGVKLPDDQFFVTGGTCAAVRSIALAHTMGFRQMELFGYDSCWPTQPDLSEKDEMGRQKYFTASCGKGTQRWTTGELLSQCQDMEEMFKNADNMDLILRVHGEGLVNDLFKNYTFSKRENYDGWFTTL